MFHIFAPEKEMCPSMALISARLRFLIEILRNKSFVPGLMDTTKKKPMTYVHYGNSAATDLTIIYLTGDGTRVVALRFE
ncbi:unnamed protein product [Didymodactylos carnosus]|uniref:Uncharacterized protein n=1 Tax=Didymodactylos carnosus TaxID=1234261 RepID=A0A814E1K0_9BILA|nr:unnamed protein product [Didymodactylos carnosus]CAF0961679.1 unnamed protein product [Didymodactylos carnosus]CAF3528377.1 unnamed protein product [Didymodactylos carnosus]CAF3736143.1 unnamed protein product [Didymodactylos carnosus]